MNNKILLTGLVSVLFLVCSSYSLSVSAEVPPGTMDHVTEMGGSLEIWVTLAHWTTGIATVALVICLIKTLRDMQASSRLAILEAEYRLRPWIAPTGPIKKNGKINQ